LPAVIATASSQSFGLETSGNGSTGTASIPFVVTPRVAPTGITVSAASDFFYGNYTSNYNISSLSFGGASLTALFVNTVFSTAPAANTVGVLLSATANAKIFGTGCEL
jgi:hypothetical protein